MTKKSPVVHSDPEILGGTPVFVGTRVPLQNLFDYLVGSDPRRDRRTGQAGRKGRGKEAPVRPGRAFDRLCQRGSQESFQGRRQEISWHAGRASPQKGDDPRRRRAADCFDTRRRQRTWALSRSFRDYRRTPGHSLAAHGGSYAPFEFFLAGAGGTLGNDRSGKIFGKVIRPIVSGIMRSLLSPARLPKESAEFSASWLGTEKSCARLTARSQFMRPKTGASRL